MTTHAFNQEVALQRAAAEELALAKHLDRLPCGRRRGATGLLNEYRDALSQEANFVKSIDKLLAFVLLKKRGDMEDKRLRFTISYSENVYFVLSSAGRSLSESAESDTGSGRDLTPHQRRRAQDPVVQQPALILALASNRAGCLVEPARHHRSSEQSAPPSAWPRCKAANSGTPSDWTMTTWRTIVEVHGQT
ncbi:hypothetical protein GPL17_33590 [Bradyrhizobium yuanmingense]|uniref:hypothetical protein n=1 Tax=Bradyrhizobium yuanmingense TaxID=108015 RepID=UPI0012F7DDE3|nr:hypothetical protein [Bradyrhizobium yuanmingense]MVT55367.1 hypothetical protein [Bradyrhizobium yuanmingense]